METDRVVGAKPRKEVKSNLKYRRVSPPCRKWGRVVGCKPVLQPAHWMLRSVLGCCGRSLGTIQELIKYYFRANK